MGTIRKKVFIENAADGRELFEQMELFPLEAERYRVALSPGYVEGLAEGDVIELEASGHWKLVRPGGATCVLVYPPREATDDARIEQTLRDLAPRHGGSLDCRSRGVFVVTLHHRDAKRVNGFVDAVSGLPFDLEWVIGNPD